MNITQLRREAGRLRSKAGMPIKQETLDQMNEAALYWLRADARKALKAQAAAEAKTRYLSALIR